MNSDETGWLKEVFRVQGLPHHIATNHDAASFIADAIVDDAGRQDVRVFSLATTVDYWERPPSKVATAQLRRITSSMQPRADKEWAVGPLRIDLRFLGMTPLNDVELSEHKFELVALSY
jgi:hypothetical protein